MYPKHDIDPKLKDSKWILSYTRAAYKDFTSVTPDGIFYQGADKYRIIDKYVLGEQDVEVYKKQFSNSDKDMSLYSKIDWAQRNIGGKFRAIAIAKILEKELDIVCTPISPTAKDEADKYFADINAKLMMREAMMKLNPEMANVPQLMPMPGEPQDLEELEIKKSYGAKHNMSIEAENCVQVVFNDSGFQSERVINAENMVDYGVGAWKDYMQDGKVKVRAVNPKNVVVSYSDYKDFRNIRHAGEIIMVPLQDLAKRFTEDQIDMIVNKYSGRYGNPASFRTSPEGVGYDSFKVAVLDFEFKSWNTKVYNRFTNSAGNIAFKKSSFNNKGRQDKVEINGETVNKYVDRTHTVVYKCKWVIDTDVIYDEGLAPNMKRSNGAPYDTELSYHFEAYNFKDMRAESYMKRIIPLIDEYHLTVYKLQNFKIRWMPYITKIDLDAIENVALTAGGEKLSPKQILNMAIQTNTVLVRQSGASGNNVNYKPIEVLPTNQHQEFTVLVNDLSRILNEIRDLTGLNEVTDGSTINAKTLNGATSMMNQSTNNALFPIMESERGLVKRLSKSVIERCSILLRSGELTGMIHSIGDNAMKIVSISKKLPLYDYGIIVDFLPTAADREMLMNRLNIKDSQGLIEPEDYFLIQNTRNLKMASQILAHRTKKRKERAMQEAMMQNEQNAKANADAGIAVEKEKQNTIEIELDMKLQLLNKEYEWKERLLKLELSGKIQGSMIQQANVGGILAEQASAEPTEAAPEVPQDPGAPMEEQPSDAVQGGELNNMF